MGARLQPELMAEQSHARSLPHNVTALGGHGRSSRDTSRPLSAIPAAAAARSSRVPLASHLRHTEHLEWHAPTASLSPGFVFPAARRHPTGRERMRSLTLQTLKYPILLLPWACFRVAAFQTQNLASTCIFASSITT
jgi:hypothetical protein